MFLCCSRASLGSLSCFLIAHTVQIFVQAHHENPNNINLFELPQILKALGVGPEGRGAPQRRSAAPRAHQSPPAGASALDRYEYSLEEMELFERDLTRLLQHIRGFRKETQSEIQDWMLIKSLVKWVGHRRANDPWVTPLLENRRNDDVLGHFHPSFQFIFVGNLVRL